MLVLPALVALATLLGSAAVAAQRLPGQAIPHHYQIELAPYFDAGTIEGFETITVEIPRATPAITVNSVGFTLRAAVRRTAESGAAEAVSAFLDAEHETAELRFDPPLAAGTARLEIAFSGKLRDDLRGLYRIRANDRWYAATQFEGTYARMMFPCFDEPAYKAKFDLTVTIDDGMTAISNGAIVRDAPGPSPGKHTVAFATSPEMSTYLVALAIGDLRCVEGASDGVPLRVCGLPEKKELGRFALAAAERFLHFYDGYYGIRYPFGKLDMVAFPEYEWGGMENTAAVFYKERALLVDAATASARTRRNVGSVVAHEMAHQWFGDLVTMRWWDNVWLNEGFATWMAHKPLQAWDPSWDQDVEATASAQQVLAADSLASTRPIRQNGTTPAEIKELFDGVAYDRGAAMLRMTEAYVGEDVFRNGVNAYLERHRNGTATAEDFWSELAKVSGKPVERMLASFIDQPGAPLVTSSSRCVDGRTSVTLTQQRFFLDPKLLAAGSPQLWTVPVCLRPLADSSRATGAAGECVLLSERSATFALAGCAPTVLVNAGARGYYRTGYAPEELRRVAAATPTLSPAEQVTLLEDQWALVRVGRAAIADYLRLAEGLRDSRNLTVASLLIRRLQTIGSVLAQSDRPAYRAWLAKLLAPAAADLGFTAPAAGGAADLGAAADSDDRRTLRATVFAALGDADDAAAIAAARRLVEQALANPADPKAVDPDLANAALPIAAAHGDAALYDRYLAAKDAAKTPEQSFRWLMALTAFHDPALVRRSLDLALSPAMRAQDLPAFTGALLGEDESRAATWEFLKAHWGTLQSKVVAFGGGGAVAALGSFCAAGAADDIEAFFTANRAPAAERTVRHSLESIRNCVDLEASLQKPLHDWIARQN